VTDAGTQIFTMEQWKSIWDEHAADCYGPRSYQLDPIRLGVLQNDALLMGVHPSYVDLWMERHGGWYELVYLLAHYDKARIRESTWGRHRYG
jgi:hypothetical protein